MIKQKSAIFLRSLLNRNKYIRKLKIIGLNFSTTMDSSAIEYPQVKREEVEETFFGKVVIKIYFLSHLGKQQKGRSLMSSKIFFWRGGSRIL